jgi:hypothetical protein
MNLKEYFERSKGFGVLATADPDGNVNGAVFARPHFIDDVSIAFIMTDRLTHANLGKNPKAAYIYRDDSGRYKGKRLYLTMLREDKNSEMIDVLRRKRDYPGKKSDDGDRFIVYFRIDKVLPLVGEE